MKKILNQPADFVPEMLDGLFLAHPDQLADSERLRIVAEQDRAQAALALGYQDRAERALPDGEADPRRRAAGTVSRG